MKRSLLVVAAVATAVALPTLRGGFVYDDVPVVAQDARIRAVRAGLVTLPYWGAEVRDRIWRPATTLSFALDWAAGGGAPLAFHVTNVLLHALVTVLVVLLAARVVGPAGAVVSGFVFAVHPVHVEAFAPVVGRSELLAAAGYLVAMVAYAADGAAGAGLRARLGWTLLVLAGAAVALGAKEHALTLPAALLLADWWESRRGAKPMVVRWRRHALLWIAVVVMAAGYVAARAAVLGSAFGAGNIAPGLDGLGAGQRALVMLPAFAIWARLLVFPLHLAADYGPAAFVPNPEVTLIHAFAALLLVALAGLIWRARARGPALLFAALWFAVTAAVAANVVVPTGVLLAERVLYLPSVAVAIAAGALWESVPMRRVLWPGTAAALTLLGARAIIRADVWRDEERFFAALERDAPASYRTWWGRGARAFAAGDGGTGEQAYRRALALNPDPAIMEELGDRYFAAGAWSPADRWFTRAWRTDPTREAAVAKALVARLQLGRAGAAASLGEEALRRPGATAGLLVTTADAWRALGRPVRALTLQRRAVFADPAEWRWQLVAADGAARAGRCEEARWRASRALARSPQAPEPGRLLGRLADGPSCGLDR